MKEPKNLYDLIIIGAGPAGMTAGIYAARKKLRTLILTQDIGGQTAWSSDVENYPGFTMITGADLVERFEHHIEKFKDTLELRLVTKGVNSIKKTKNGFEVGMAAGKKETAKAVIIAGGKLPRHLDVVGEKEFLNRGVTYCAWCDGPLFAGRDVAVIGGGNSALDAVLNIKNSVKSIVIINNMPQLTGDAIMIEKITDDPHIRVLNNTTVQSINGKKFVESITVQDSSNQKKSNLAVAGVFIEIGSNPATEYLKKTVKLNKNAEIIIDSNNMSSTPGIFAAGDITEVAEKQIVISAGEGAKAAICAAKYLARQK